MNNDIAISVNDVAKIYNLYEKNADRLKEAVFRQNRHKEHFALNNISFKVYRGETFGVIGTNGAGKSTLLKLITGVAAPTTGEIRVDGRIAALLELGAGFNTEYTGLENIYLNGTMMGYTRSEMKERVDSILQFADIGDFIYQPVKTYSSGMFARLAFAVAINVEPEILIVDEALSVGDVFFQNKCYRKFEELKKKNTTVIFVSHDLGSVRQMCDRVLWIEKGIQQMVGDTKTVCDAYSNARIKETNILNKDVQLDDRRQVTHFKECKKTLTNVPKIRGDAEGTYSKDASILSAFVMDSKGQIVKEIFPDNEYSINMIIEFYKDIEGVFFGFSVENIKGVKIFGYNTYAKDKLMYDVKKGKFYYLSFSFILPRIETGNYLIGVAASTGTQEMPIILTWIYSATQVRVERSGYNLALLDVDCELSTTIVKNINLY